MFSAALRLSSTITIASTRSETLMFFKDLGGREFGAFIQFGPMRFKRVMRVGAKALAQHCSGRVPRFFSSTFHDRCSDVSNSLV